MDSLHPIQFQQRIPTEEETDTDRVQGTVVAPGEKVMTSFRMKGRGDRHPEVHGMATELTDGSGYKARAFTSADSIWNPYKNVSRYENPGFEEVSETRKLRTPFRANVAAVALANRHLRNLPRMGSGLSE